MYPCLAMILSSSSSTLVRLFRPGEIILFRILLLQYRRQLAENSPVYMFSGIPFYGFFSRGLLEFIFETWVVRQKTEQCPMYQDRKRYLPVWFVVPSRAGFICYYKYSYRQRAEKNTPVYHSEFSMGSADGRTDGRARTFRLFRYITKPSFGKARKYVHSKTLTFV